MKTCAQCGASFTRAPKRADWQWEQQRRRLRRDVHAAQDEAGAQADLLAGLQVAADVDPERREEGVGMNDEERLQRVRGVAEELDREAVRGNPAFAELRREHADRIRQALGDENEGL